MIVWPGLRRSVSAISRLFNSATFDAPLTHSLSLSRGTGTATFTRATTATVRDNEGVLRTAIAGEARFEGARRVRNLLTYTEDFSNAAWTKTNTTAGVAQILEIATSAVHYVLSSAFTSVGATIYSVNATSINGRSLQIRPNGLGLNKAYANFDLVNGVVGSTGGTEFSSASIQSLGAGEYRCTMIANHAATPSNAQLTVITSASAAENESFAGDITKGISLSKAQVENVTAQTTQTAGEYVSVGVESAPYYHGSMVDGVKCFATDINGAAIPSTTLLGYLAEGARTNLVWPSEDLTHVRYVSGCGGIAVVADQAVAPDGTTTADQLTASGANGTLIQDLGVIASAAQAFSLYLKRKTGTGNVDITLDGGATWTTQTITTTEWTRCQITQTVANPDVGIRIVTSGDAIYAWGLQCE